MFTEPLSKFLNYEKPIPNCLLIVMLVAFYMAMDSLNGEKFACTFDFGALFQTQMQNENNLYRLFGASAFDEQGNLCSAIYFWTMTFYPLHIQCNQITRYIFHSLCMCVEFFCTDEGKQKRQISLFSNSNYSEQIWKQKREKWKKGKSQHMMHIWIFWTKEMRDSSTFESKPSSVSNENNAFVELSFNGILPLNGPLFLLQIKSCMETSDI